MKISFFIIMLMILIPIQVFSQTEMATKAKEGVPEFYYDIINVASHKPNLSRVNIYIEVPYDELQFVKEDDEYKAEYEVTAVIYDKDGEQVDGKIWQEEITVLDYKLTNSRKFYSLTNAEFHLNPAEFRVSIGLMDIDSKSTGFRKTRIDLRDFSNKKLSISDLTFTDKIEIDSLGIKSIHPQVSDYIRTESTALLCYFELYSKLKNDSRFEISYIVKNAKNKTVLEQDYLRRKDAFRTMEYIRLQKTELTHGKYKLEIKVKQGKYRDSITKNFVLRWAGAPSTVADLDLAAEQLKYIAKGADFKKINNASRDEKLLKFKEFWKKRDPSPGTEKNELMTEYYRRIEYANENYSGFKEGWKTDMGMIYVRFGPPNDIERHPFDRSYKPYEIWYYYQINRQFVFIDETGFGEYRLTNPYSWRDWNDGIYY